MEEYKRERLAHTLSFYSSPIFYHQFYSLHLELAFMSSSSSTFTSPLLSSPIQLTPPVELPFMVSPDEVASLENRPLLMSHPYNHTHQAIVGNVGPYREHSRATRHLVSQSNTPHSTISPNIHKSCQSRCTQWSPRAWPKRFSSDCYPWSWNGWSACMGGSSRWLHKPSVWWDVR